MADNKWQEYLNKQADLLDRGVIDLRQYNDAVKDAKAGLIGYTENLRNSTNQLKKNLVSLGGAMVEGKQGASVYNQSISGAADVIDSIASKFGFLGKVLGTAVTAGAKYVVAVNEQADKLFETYQDISRTGLATGMDDVFTNLQDMGYTMKEVGKMGALLKENSTTLATFAGTAANGAKQFSAISRDLQYSDVGNQLKLMGMTTDDINQGAAGYMRLQQLNGSLQKQTNEQLAAGAEKYIYEQDRLAKLTGINAKTQNEIIERAISDQRYGARQAELQRAGDEKSLAEAKRNNELLIKYSAQFGPKTAKAFQDYAAGTMNSEDAQKFQRSFPQAAEAIDKGYATADEIMDLTYKDAEENRKSFTNLAKSGVTDKVITDMAEIIKGSQYADGKTAVEKTKEATEEIEGQTSGKDKQVKNMVALVQSQRNQTMAMEKLLNDGIKPVTAGVKMLSKGIEKVTGAAAGLAGREGRVGGEGKGPPPEKITDLTPDKLLTFSGGTGDLAHFNQLNPTVYNSFLQMANEYYQMSGKKLQVNSAFRSEEEQKNVNSGTNPKAAPGKSLHNQGKAVDINSSQVADLLAKGLLGKFGFSPLPGDPPHIQMPQAATGGILSGPTTGYQAMLHGTEAVVPMNNKQAITVDTGGNTTEKQQLDIIAKKIAAIDMAISGMNRSNSNATKILQRQS